MDWYPALRALLFRLEAERAHRLTLNLLALAGRLPPLRAWLRRAFCAPRPGPRRQVFGLTFANPLGLAAGYDKDGRAILGLACLGFGHLEVGTVTPSPQPGNPRPRLFRLPQDQALINRMGFPNAGAAALLRRLRRARPPGVVLGINLGKGVDTPLEAAAEDYLHLLRLFYAHADYLVINVSSPNTLGLRRLQAREHLDSLLSTLAAERAALAAELGRRTPLLVKFSPDLQDAEWEDVFAVLVENGMDGVILVNTTVARPHLSSPAAGEAGGLSGPPLRARATALVRRVNQISGGALPIIGVGGIDGVQAAQERLAAGASLLQIYTGLVYQGPGLVSRILEGLREHERLAAG